MRKHSLSFLILPVLLFSVMPSVATAEMASSSFTIAPSVMDSTGTEKASANYKLVDAVGQGTPIGPSDGTYFSMKAGFIYGNEFSLPIDDAVTKVIDAIIAIINDPDIPLSKQEDKSFNLAIAFLEDALAAFALYEAGDDAALANALNKIKSAINKMEAVSYDTAVYQKMLAEAAELGVTTRINEIAAMVGSSDPDIVQAGIELAQGSDEILNGLFNQAVQSFVQAYNQALLAL